jgi:hypothetical protein
MLRWLWISCVLVISLRAGAAQLILNEVNAVSAGNYLNGGTAAADESGGQAADPFFGRVPGNGGDWLELAVVADGLDVRGWTLDFYELGAFRTRLTLSADPLWASLAAGTLITIAEDVAEDPGYDPAAGDWQIRVRAGALGSGLYISALDFPASHDDWQLVIRDAAGNPVFGPAGEGVAGVGVNSRETFRLETDPSALVAPDSTSYNDAVSSSFDAPNVYAAGAAVQDFSALRLGLPIPDRDGDGVADDGDRSGIAGDAPCATNVSAGCDDNCPATANASQQDSGGVGAGGPDGRGNACQCGDVDDDGAVTPSDASGLRAWLAGTLAGLPAAAKCGVVNDGRCSVADASVLRRVTDAGLAPAPAQVCGAATPPASSADIYFDPTRVLDVEVTMSPADWETLRNQTRYLYAYLYSPTCGDGPFPSPYTWFPATVRVDGVSVQQAGIRKKGFVGSLSTTKPALKLDFGQYVGGRTLNGLGSMTLNNARQDPSYVKQCVGAMMLADAGVPVGRCNFARVRVNGQDLGVYVNVEEYKAPLLERVYGSADGKLYEGTLSDFWPGDWRGTFEIESSAAADTRELDALVAALQLPDAELLAAVEPLVDLPAFVNFWAAGALIGDWDGYTNNQNNFWIYLHPGSRRFHFLPWGIDDVLGRGNPAFYEDPVNAPAVVPRSTLARRLYAQLDTQLAFLDRLVYLAQQVWNPPRYLAEIDRIEALITPYTGDLTAPLAPVRDWVALRRSRVEAELDMGAPVWTEGQRDHPCVY